MRSDTYSTLAADSGHESPRRCADRHASVLAIAEEFVGRAFGPYMTDEERRCMPERVIELVTAQFQDLPARQREDAVRARLMELRDLAITLVTNGAIRA